MLDNARAKDVYSDEEEQYLMEKKPSRTPPKTPDSDGRGGGGEA